MQKLNGHLLVNKNPGIWRCRKCGIIGDQEYFDFHKCAIQEQECICKVPYQQYYCPVHWYVSQHDENMKKQAEITKKPTVISRQEETCDIFVTMGYHLCRCGKQFI